MPSSNIPNEPITHELDSYHKRYYRDHREEILKNAKRMIKCKCGKELRRSSYKKHMMGNLHNNLLRMAKMEEDYNKGRVTIDKFVTKSDTPPPKKKSSKSQK